MMTDTSFPLRTNDSDNKLSQSEIFSPDFISTEEKLLHPDDWDKQLPPEQPINYN